MTAPTDEQIRLPDRRTETGTRTFFGKPYHWARNAAGRLVLMHGPDPRTITTSEFLDILGPRPAEKLTKGVRG
jgi:hypothetical protein